ADVGFNGAERVVGRLRRSGLCQRVEEGGLADIRQAHDAAFEAHRVVSLGSALLAASPAQPFLEVLGERTAALGLALAGSMRDSRCRPGRGLRRFVVLLAGSITAS